MRRPILALLVLAAVSACTPMSWQQNGVPVSQALDDADECRRIARTFALRYASGAGLGPFRAYPYRDYRYGSTYWFDRQFDRQMTEMQVTQACMREKGYTLAPSEP